MNLNCIGKGAYSDFNVTSLNASTSDYFFTPIAIMVPTLMSEDPSVKNF